MDRGTKMSAPSTSGLSVNYCYELSTLNNVALLFAFKQLPHEMLAVHPPHPLGRESVRHGSARKSQHCHLTLKMASAQLGETSVTNNSPSQDFNHPDDLFQSRYATPGFKPFSYEQYGCHA